MIRKKKPCKGCNKEAYIFSGGNCESCSKKLKIAKVKEIKPKKKEKTISQLKKELDTIFSLFIRKFYSKDGLSVECYCCGVVKPIKEMQNAHFWSRGNLSTRWEEINCRPNCVGCNVFKHGNYIVYTRKMLDELGEEKFNELEQLKNTMFKSNVNWFKSQIEDYKQKVNELSDKL